jgi:hypothetical protein
VIARNAPVLILVAATAAAMLMSPAPADAADVCTHWNIPQRLSIYQSNNFTVTLLGEGNELRGKAFASQAHAVAGSGTFDGKTRGHEIEISIYWGPDSIGVYTGKINNNGRMEGRTHDRKHPNQIATWYADQLASCTKWEWETKKQ